MFPRHDDGTVEPTYSVNKCKSRLVPTRTRTYRSMRLHSVLGQAAVAALIVAAQRADAQNSATTSYACKTWAADVIDSRTGKKTGAIFSLKDDRASIEQATAHDVQDWKRLCKYFGPRDNDCFSKATAPYCADIASHPKQSDTFTVRVDRRCVAADGTVRGTLSVNWQVIGDVSENAQTLIAPGLYTGSLRNSSAHPNVQGQFGTMGRSGGDFLLEVNGVQCASGRTRTGLEFHSGTKASDSRGCVLLGPASKQNGVRFLPDVDTSLLSRLRTAFYGSKLPNATPDRPIQLEFGQPATLPVCR